MGLFGRKGKEAKRHTDPVCGMVVVEGEAVGPDTIRGEAYWFCSAECQDQYQETSTGSRRSRRDQQRSRRERKQRVVH